MNKAISIILMLAAAGFAASASAQDAKAGERKSAMCIGCHGIPGYQASFPEIHKVPMIAGQGAKYIVSALGAYQKGERKHPTMRAVASSLSEQDMADLGAYYEKLGQGAAAAAAPAAAAEPPAAVAALLAKGNCASCHGASFGAPVDASYPKLAGQHPDYLYAALKSYQTQNNTLIGRSNAIMGGMAAPFSRKELKLLAEYLGSLPGTLETVPEPRFR